MARSKRYPQRQQLASGRKPNFALTNEPMLVMLGSVENIKPHLRNFTNERVNVFYYERKLENP